jgi:osmotically-inducible protein OsmY
MSAALLLVAAHLTACSTTPPKSLEQAQEDEATTARLYAALNADPIYYFRHVDVQVDNGVAQLSGYIWDTDALYRLKQIAESTPGVKRVVNQMELERNGNRGGGHSGTG